MFVYWILGSSLHCHAGGSCYQEAGVEQRRETCTFLHAGHPDLEKGKNKALRYSKVFCNVIVYVIKTLEYEKNIQTHRFVVYSLQQLVVSFIRHGGVLLLTRPN